MATVQRTPAAKGSPKLSGEILDRQPPANLDAEKAVLGSILLLPESYDDLAHIVRSDDFYDESHRVLFGHLADMHDAGRRIDLTLLVERLKSTGDLERVGGAAYLAEVYQSVPHAAHAVHYAEIVRDKAQLRSLIHASTEILRDAYDTADPRSTVNRAEERIFAIGDNRDSGKQLPIKVVLDEALKRIDIRMEHGHAVGGVETGFNDLDELMGGLRDGELTILAARPSMGKTSLALNIAEFVSLKLAIPTVVFSLEMSQYELGERFLCALAEVDAHKLRNGRISREETQRIMQAAGALSEAPLFIDDSPSRTMTEIAAAARRLKRKHKLGLVVIDYLTLIEPDNPNDGRQEQVARIARRLKNMARELKLPVLCLAQLNRQVEVSRESKPRLSHLRESGAIEQDADVVLFVHREEYYQTSEEERARVAGEADLIVAKQRNGPTGDIKLVWRKEFTRFSNAASRQYNEHEQFQGDF